MSRLRPWRVAPLMLVAVAVAGADAARAQNPWRPGMQNAPPKPAPLQLSGTLTDVRPGVIQVKSDADKLWLLQVPRNARVRLTGQARVEFLASGQWVELVAEVDKRRGTASQPIAKLTLFTPTERRQRGVVPDQGFGFPGDSLALDGKKGDGPKRLPGAGAGRIPGAGAEPGLGPGPDKGRGGRRAGPGAGAKEAPLSTQSFEIRGQIISIKAGKMSLHAPNPYFKSPLKLEVAEEAQIGVELVGPEALFLADPGDKVTILGEQLGETVGRIAELEIVAREPLGGVPAKKRAAGKPDRPSRAAQPAPKDSPPDAAPDAAPEPKKPAAKKGRKSIDAP